MANEMLMKGMPLKATTKLAFPAWAEAKYDECRCRVWLTNGGDIRFDSYAGKPLHNLYNEFGLEFTKFMKAEGIHELDIGIEVNGNFNDSYRWVRSSKGWPQESVDKMTGKVAPALDDSMVKFYLFDLPLDTSVFADRKVHRERAVTLLRYWHLNVHEPEGQMVRDRAELDAWFRHCRRAKREGAMVKTLGHRYRRGKHTGSWWKMKPHDNIDGCITALNEAVSEDGVKLGRVGSVDVVCEDGSKASPAGFPHELGRMMWLYPAKYIGNWIEFGYMERDRAGGYRHPSFNRFREDKQ